MKNKLETIDLAKLTAVNGGINWGSVIDKVKPNLPSPTIPLGPFYPPKPDRWV